MGRLTVLLVVVAAALSAGVPALGSTRSVVVFFRTPSGNISCAYNSADSTVPAFLRCDIRSHLHPAPAPHRCLEGVYGESVGMTRTGAAHVLCISDTVVVPNAYVLAYGTSWARNGFRCTSRSAGLTCTNSRGHGFFLSRRSWRVH
jgi:Family of unknown function (DUF6636)